jgi:hypothetical protein
LSFREIVIRTSSYQLLFYQPFRVYTVCISRPKALQPGFGGQITRYCGPPFSVKVEDTWYSCQTLDSPNSQFCQRFLTYVTCFVKCLDPIYIEKHLGDLNFEEKAHKTVQKLLTKNRLLEFKTIFQEILNIGPFANAKERNIDVINALNFGIFYELRRFKMEKKSFNLSAFDAML